MPKAIETVETKPLTDEEVETKRAALLAELADLPPLPAPTGAKPGDKVTRPGGIIEYVDFTANWFTDVEARKKDRDDQGRLIWPNYALREITPAKDEVITVNGVSFAIYAGRDCKLPDPHYHAWKNTQDQLRRNDREFSKPDAPREANAMTLPHKMADGPIRDRQA